MKPSSNSMTMLSYIKAIVLAFVLVYFLTAIFFSVFYYTSNYEYLTNWFLSLNNCFYKSDVWQKEFFTTSVKKVGDYYSIASIIVSSLGVFFFSRKLFQIFKQKDKLTIRVLTPKEHLIGYILLLLIAILLWLYNHTFILPWYDEVFSGKFISELHPFQTLAYYMLPNNHVFFNLLNNILFFWTEQKVLTGRIISLCAYVGVMWCIYFWLKKVVHVKCLAFSMVILLAMHYPIWSFGTQARGYELQLLMAWICFISIENYFDQNRKFWWSLFSFAAIIGFITVPTFLFYYSACLGYVLYRMWLTKNACWSFWKNQLLVLIIVFLFYLPAICFSGLNSITHNQYVSPEVKTAIEYMPVLGKMMHRYILYCFAFNCDGSIWLNYAFIFIPLYLFFVKNKTIQRLAVFFVLQWLAFLVLNTKMLSAVPCRTLLLQYSFTMAFGVLAVYYFFHNLFKKKEKWATRFSLVFLLLMGIHFCNTQRHSLNQLYGPETNKTFQINEAGIKHLPKGYSVAFSNESFLWIYLAQHKNYELHPCPQGNETFYVKRSFENLPQPYQGYQLYFKADDFYEIYKKVDK